MTEEDLAGKSPKEILGGFTSLFSGEPSKNEMPGKLEAEQLQIDCAHRNIAMLTAGRGINYVFLMSLYRPCNLLSTLRVLIICRSN